MGTLDYLVELSGIPCANLFHKTGLTKDPCGSPISTSFEVDPSPESRITEVVVLAVRKLVVRYIYMVVPSAPILAVVRSKLENHTLRLIQQRYFTQDYLSRLHLDIIKSEICRLSIRR